MITSAHGKNRQRENARYGRKYHRIIHTAYAVECPHCHFRPFIYDDLVPDGVCSNLGKGCGQSVGAQEWIITLKWTY